MDNSKYIFHQTFIKRNYPPYVDEDFVYDVFQNVLFELSDKVESGFSQGLINPNVLLNYIVEEYSYIVAPLKDSDRQKLNEDDNFKKRLISSLTNKIFFNEYLPYKAKPLINQYHPLISTLRFFLNFVLDRIYNLKFDKEIDILIVDMFRKAFLSCIGVTSLLVEGFETEAFSTWRTIHETECIIKIIYENPYLINTYKRHIEYNHAFRDEFDDKVKQQKVIDEIKSHLKEHDLKSKDLKKYIEYGWLYSIKDVKEKYPNFKINFRNGFEYVAGLSSCSSLYEMSSEIAHSSPLLIYSNKPYFLRITIISLYQTFLRLEELFSDLLLKTKKEESQSYFLMRSSCLNELKVMLEREENNFKMFN